MERQQKADATLRLGERKAASLYFRRAVQPVDVSDAVSMARPEPGTPGYLVGRRPMTRVGAWCPLGGSRDSGNAGLDPVAGDISPEMARGTTPAVNLCLWVGLSSPALSSSHLTLCVPTTAQPTPPQHQTSHSVPKWRHSHWSRYPVPPLPLQIACTSYISSKNGAYAMSKPYGIYLHTHDICTRPPPLPGTHCDSHMPSAYPPCRFQGYISGTGISCADLLPSA